MVGCAQVPIYGHVVCGGCSIMLMYPVGAQSVKCSVCHFVTAAPAPGPNGAPPPPPQQPQQPGSGSQPPAGGGGPQGAGRPGQTVVIENPPSLDDNGNEVGKLLGRLLKRGGKG
jgi:LSD1 subclass zinc finger protein